MAQVAIQVVNEASVIPTAAAGDTVNGDKVANPNGDVFLLLQNTHATNTETFTMTVNSVPTTPKYGTVTKTAEAYVVAALGNILAGPFPTGSFNDGNGNISVAYSGTGTPKISAFKLSGAKIV